MKKRSPCGACGAREKLGGLGLCAKCERLTGVGIAELEEWVRLATVLPRRRSNRRPTMVQLKTREESETKNLGELLRQTAVIAWLDRRSRRWEGLPVREGHIANLVAGDAVYRRLTGALI